MKQEKICVVCAKPFTNRKKWAKRGIFGEVKYCSNRCRNQRSKLKKDEKRKN